MLYILVFCVAAHRSMADQRNTHGVVAAVRGEGILKLEPCVSVSVLGLSQGKILCFLPTGYSSSAAEAHAAIMFSPHVLPGDYHFAMPDLMLLIASIK